MTIDPKSPAQTRPAPLPTAATAHKPGTNFESADSVGEAVQASFINVLLASTPGTPISCDVASVAAAPVVDPSTPPTRTISGAVLSTETPGAALQNPGDIAAWMPLGMEEISRPSPVQALEREQPSDDDAKPPADTMAQPGLSGLPPVMPGIGPAPAHATEIASALSVTGTVRHTTESRVRTDMGAMHGGTTGTPVHPEAAMQARDAATQTVSAMDMGTRNSALSPEAAAVRERLVRPHQDAGLITLPAFSAGTDTPPMTDAQVTENVSPPRTPLRLMTALGERIEVQLQKGSERTVIRLDPPMQGSIEIVIRREAGAIHVQLNATQSDVARQLQQVSDTLRQDLASRQGGDVSVFVSHGQSRGGDARERSPQQHESHEPGQALAEADAGHADQRFSLSSLTH